MMMVKKMSDIQSLFDQQIYIPLTAGQLKELLEGIDDEKPIRIWVECKNDEDVSYFQGRKLAGLVDDGDYCCLVAMYYKEDEL